MNELVPSEFFLSQNYPNPFSGRTKIKFCVPFRTTVKIEVFNTEGRLIKKVLDEEKFAGSYEVVFDTTACNVDKSWHLEEGMYTYQLKAGPSSGLEQVYVETKKMLLIK